MKILVYSKDPNPYQDLLYSKFDKNNIVTYLLNPTSSHLLGLLLLPFQIIKYRLQGYQIFHLHWIFMFQISHPNPFFRNNVFKTIFMIYFLFIFLTIKICRYKLVWTTHDLVPHGTVFINDKFVSKMLAKFSNAKILHSNETLNQMKKMKFNIENIKIIPIGNYIQVYPNKISQKKARSKLKIGNDKFVFGYFGRVELYKGIISLVDSFVELNSKNATLVIAGPCYDPQIKKYLENKVKINPEIKLFLQFIPDEEVQYYLNSADIFVYPFIKVTTSSSVVLAMSFKKPLICALVGEINDIPKNTGYYFKPDKNNESLKNLLKYVISHKSEIKVLSKNAYKFALSNSWDKIARKTQDLYSEIL